MPDVPAALAALTEGLPANRLSVWATARKGEDVAALSQQGSTP
jgi:hypothetical protein